MFLLVIWYIHIAGNTMENC